MISTLVSSYIIFAAPGDYDVPSILGHRVPDSLISTAPGYTFGGDARFISRSSEKSKFSSKQIPGVGDYRLEKRPDMVKTPRATIGNASRFD